MTTAPPIHPGARGFSPALNCVGAVVVGFWVVTLDASASPVVLGVSLLAVVAWLVRAITRSEVVADVASLVMVAGGSAMVQPTDALLITPAIVAIAGVTATTRHRFVTGPLLGAAGFTIAVVAGLTAERPLAFFVGILAGYALGVVVGVSRRQNALAVDRDRALAERELELERQRNRSAFLTDRATIARDIHDLLAHSLGGLVIQLDAVEALLENGSTDEAATRVAAARTLAADGLGEARRAVATLRDPSADSGATDVPAAAAAADPRAIERLLETHVELGGHIAVAGEVHLDLLDESHRRALAGVLREALSNARRHAPGRAVQVTFSVEAGGGILRAVIENTVDESHGASASPGGGAGLPGMRSRLAELGDGSHLEAGRQGDSFVVVAELPAGVGR